MGLLLFVCFCLLLLFFLTRESDSGVKIFHENNSRVTIFLEKMTSD